IRAFHVTGVQTCALPISGETSPHPIAILPLGATEQHGPHLPQETDWIIAQAVAGRLEQRLGASMPLTVLPVEKLGYSVEHLDLEIGRASCRERVESSVGA